MVHILAINPSPLFQIRVENDNLTLHGSKSESVGCILRGQLVLALTETTKFKEIRLTFQGESKVSLYDAFSKATEIIYQHNWIFLPKKSNYHVLQPNNYHWNFELVLPGTVPETIEGFEHGSINYKLEAVAERHTFAVNLHTHRAIKIQRCLLASALEFVQGIVVANTWTNKLYYEFSVDSKAFAIGEKIPITIIIRPLQIYLKVYRFTCTLQEYITHRAGINKKTHSRVVESIVDNHYPCDGEIWANLIEMMIPKSCLYDAENDVIQVCHKLKFSIIFMNEDEHLSELKADMSVIITPLSSNDEDLALPAYNEHIIDMAYSDEGLMSNSHYEEFDSLNLNQLPSYHSIASSIPAPFTDSLLPPTYDLIF